MNHPGTLRKITRKDDCRFFHLRSAIWVYAERYNLCLIDKTWEIFYIHAENEDRHILAGSKHKTRKDAVAAIDEYLENFR